MSGYKAYRTARLTALGRALCVLLAAITLSGCSSGPDEQQQALAFTQDWFDRAVAGARDDTLCHGLGMLKHPQFTCAELLEHAGRVDPGQRTLTGYEPRDCLADVCGHFVELTFSGTQFDGALSDEIVVLKKDDGRYRLYWYRNSSLLALLGPADAREEDTKDPEQAAYDAMTQRYPSLYQWPPCYDVRVSSRNLMGELTPGDALDETLIASQAAACGDSFCFAYVGRKVASVCPERRN